MHYTEPKRSPPWSPCYTRTGTVLLSCRRRCGGKLGGRLAAPLSPSEHRSSDGAARRPSGDARWGGIWYRVTRPGSGVWTARHAHERERSRGETNSGTRGAPPLPPQRGSRLRGTCGEVRSADSGPRSPPAAFLKAPESGMGPGLALSYTAARARWASGVSAHCGLATSLGKHSCCDEVQRRISMYACMGPVKVASLAGCR